MPEGLRGCAIKGSRSLASRGLLSDFCGFFFVFCFVRTEHSLVQRRFSGMAQGTSVA